MPEENGKTKTELSIPVAIIIAGIFISISIFAANNPRGSIADNGTVDNSDQIEPVKVADINMRPVGNEDHIRGGLDATVKVVVFSDPECPFCKKFHSTMKQVMDNYKIGNKVAWVYRSFPLDALHPKARKESEALECANELGGNDKFWSYLDRLMTITPSNNQLDPTQLPEIASFVKLDENKFQTCLNSGKYADKVQKDVDDAISAGGRGTPYSVIISASGQKTPVDGAWDYDSLKASIDSALKN